MQSITYPGNPKLKQKISGIFRGLGYVKERETKFQVDGLLQKLEKLGDKCVLHCREGRLEGTKRSVMGKRPS